MFARSHKAGWLLPVVLGLLLLLLLPGVSAAERPVFPDLVPLPVGFAPEGIAAGRGTTFYAGSTVGMGIFRGDVRTGQGALLPGTAGEPYLGMKLDRRTDNLFVAGGPSGMAFVFNADTGARLAALQLAQPNTSFINDVILTRDAAYFTNSSQPVFYRLALGHGGRLGSAPAAQALTLTGEWQQGTGFGANGIEATPDGRYLIIVNTNLGLLFRVDPQTGDARVIDLGGATVTNGDGILLQGKTLYVVRNQNNEIAVLRLQPDFLAARLVDTLTNSNFDVPTTIARFGNALYAVNAKFGTPPTGTPYEVVRVPLEDEDR